MVKIGKQHLMLIVCGDVESNLGPGSDERVCVLYSNILGLHANFAGWLWRDQIMMFWFVLSLQSLIAAISQSCISVALVSPNRGCRAPLLVSRYGSLCKGRVPLKSQVGMFLL